MGQIWYLQNPLNNQESRDFTTIKGFFFKVFQQNNAVERWDHKNRVNRTPIVEQKIVKSQCGAGPRKGRLCLEKKLTIITAALRVDRQVVVDSIYKI